MTIQKYGAIIGSSITSFLALIFALKALKAIINPTTENIAEIIEEQAIPLWIGPLQWITSNPSPTIVFLGVLGLIAFLKWTKLA